MLFLVFLPSLDQSQNLSHYMVLQILLMFGLLKEISFQIFRQIFVMSKDCLTRAACQIYNSLLNFFLFYSNTTLACQLDGL